jgi:hypothetical protein
MWMIALTVLGGCGGPHNIIQSPTDTSTTDTGTVDTSTTTAPACVSIDAPAEDGDHFSATAAITFEGSVDSAVTGPTVSWTSSLDGDLGCAPQVTNNATTCDATLQAGQHLVVLTVTDATGHTCSATRQVIVDP